MLLDEMAVRLYARLPRSTAEELAGYDELEWRHLASRLKNLLNKQPPPCGEGEAHA